jgi:glucose/arabinose dehydrogenase
MNSSRRHPSTVPIRPLPAPEKSLFPDEPSANRITLLRDRAGDGAHVERHVFLQNLNSPIGMVLVGGTFYVGLAIDKQGSLLVADDVGNTVWRVGSLL